jgi:hypothetical protein
MVGPTGGRALGILQLGLLPCTLGWESGHLLPFQQTAPPGTVLGTSPSLQR